MAWLCSDGALQILLALICAIFSGYTVLMYDVCNCIKLVKSFFQTFWKTAFVQYTWKIAIVYYCICAHTNEHICCGCDNRKDLDVDHYGLDKLKKRVVEYLAVRQIKNTLRGPILCFVGPPGVGKTSVGRSIAKTLSRQFHRCCTLLVTKS